MYKRQVQVLPGRLHELLGGYSSSGYAEYSLSVQNVGANPRCVYLPYGLLPGEAPDPEFKDVDDAFTKAGNSVFGLKEYQVQAMTEEAPDSFYSRFFLSVPGAALHESHPELIPDTTGVEGSELESWFPSSPLLELLSEPVSEFSQTFQKYTDFVYSRYTQLPVELYPVLRNYLEEHGLLPEYFDSTQELASDVYKRQPVILPFIPAGIKLSRHHQRSGLPAEILRQQRRKIGTLQILGSTLVELHKFPYSG